MSELPLLLVAVACPASAAQFATEAWRSPFGSARAVAVDPSDGSCWAAVGSSVMHVADGGTLLSQTNGFWAPESLSVDPSDGSCWVADTWNDAVVHLDKHGAEQLRTWGFDFPVSVSANPTDWSCWVASRGSGQIEHLSEFGATLWEGGGFPGASAISVNPADGSCWVAWAVDPHASGVAHLDRDGTELWRGQQFGGPASLSVNPEDGSCWVADWAGNQVVHLAEDGTELWRGGGFENPVSVSANPQDDSCWVADYGRDEVVHLAESGAELWRGGSFQWPRSAAVNPIDGSCWVADLASNQLVHLAEDGEELWRGGGRYQTESVSVNLYDSSCWATDSLDAQVVHVAEDGAELWRGGSFSGQPNLVAVNPTNDSCWVADDAQVIRLRGDGSEAWRGGSLLGQPRALAANATDGSCWVADFSQSTGAGEVVHLSRRGIELWRGSFGQPISLSVDQEDGSCWVADAGAEQVVHLAADGSELVRIGGLRGSPAFVSANSQDGSCWVLLDEGEGSGRVLHLDQTGAEVGQSPGFSAGGSLSVNPVDDSCWVVDSYRYQVAHLAQDGTRLWWGGGFYLPSSISVDESNGSCWVADTGNGQVVHLAITGSPTADFSAFPTAGIAPLMVRFADRSSGSPLSRLWQFGDGATSRQLNPVHTYEAPGSKTVKLMVTNGWGYDTAIGRRGIRVAFPDAPPGFWAWLEIIACVDARIVLGYPDVTYRPSLPVTRDQMAVYISRAVAGGEAGVPPGPGHAYFSDVPTSHWAYKYIEYARANQIVEGYEDGSYRPLATLDRGQMAAFIARAIAYPMGDEGLAGYVPPTHPSFADVPAAFWAFKYIEYLAQGSVAVVRGYLDGLYHPEYVCSRDQMAVYVQRALELPM